MVSEISQNNVAKQYQKQKKLSTIFGEFRGLKDQYYQIYEATFHSQLFITSNFYSCQKTPEGLET